VIKLLEKTFEIKVSFIEFFAFYHPLFIELKLVYLFRLLRVLIHSQLQNFGESLTYTSPLSFQWKIWKGLVNWKLQNKCVSRQLQVSYTYMLLSWLQLHINN
jgi:hypothetical protein